MARCALATDLAHQSKYSFVPMAEHRHIRPTSGQCHVGELRVPRRFAQTNGDEPDADDTFGNIAADIPVDQKRPESTS